MERIYFSKQNFGIIYNILRKKTMSALNYDISNDETINNELVKVMKSLYGKRNTFNIPSNLSDLDRSRYLSQKVINVATPYFIDTIKKSRVSNEQVNLTRDLNLNNNSRINQLSNRPQVNNKDNSNIKGDYNRLIKEREQVNTNIQNNSNNTNYNINNRLDQVSARTNSGNNSNVNSSYDQMLKERSLQSNNTSNVNFDTPRPVNFGKDNNSNPTSDQINDRYNKLAAERDYQLNNNSFQHPSNVDKNNFSNQQFLNTNKINSEIQNSNNPNPNTVNQFNAFPQSNPNTFNSNVINNNSSSQNRNNNPSDNLNLNPYNSDSHSGVMNQFKSIKNTTELISAEPLAPSSNEMSNFLSMNGDNLNYEELIKDMDTPAPIKNTSMPNTNINKQFMNNFTKQNTSEINRENNIENIFPKNLVENSNEKSMENNKNIQPKDNIELQIIKKSIDNQQVNFRNTDSKIEQLIEIMKNQDISKLYQTVINIPALLKRQMNEKYRFKKHSLIISSRDRDLSNKDFNKYNFRVVFGDTSTNVTRRRITNSTAYNIEINSSAHSGNFLISDTSTDSTTLRKYNPINNNSVNIYDNNTLLGLLSLSNNLIGSISEIEIAQDNTTNNLLKGNGWTIGDRITINNTSGKDAIIEITDVSATGVVENYRVVDAGSGFPIGTANSIDYTNSSSTENLKFKYKVNNDTINPQAIKHFTSDKFYRDSNIVVKINSSEFRVREVNNQNLIFNNTVLFKVGDRVKYTNLILTNTDIGGLSNNNEYYVSQLTTTYKNNDTISLRRINGGSNITFTGTITSQHKHMFKIDTLLMNNSTVNKPLIIKNISNSSSVSLQNKTFESSASKNPVISTKLKNIVSIKLNRVIIPKPRDEVFKPDPYYFVCIDEFGSNVITTKHFNEKIFSKVHFDKELIFGGIADSAITNNTPSSTVINADRDDGRKYMYYKNDDGDETTFYSSPLGSLENLTIKILDSRGRILSDNFNDSDRGIYNQNPAANTPNISAKFLNNAFTKDNIINLTNNKEGHISNIAGVSYFIAGNQTPNYNSPVAGNIKLNYDNEDPANNSPNNNDELINLTNQIEYIFEVVTKERDVEKDYMADLI